MVWPFKKRDLEAEEHKRIFETALPGIGAVEELAKLKGQKVDRPSTKEEPSSLSKLIGFGKKTTVKVCPEHGEVVPKEDNKCPQCGRQLTTKRSPIGHLLSFPFYLASFMGSIYIFLNPLISSIFPYPEFIPALWFVILLVGFYIAYKLMKMSIFTGIILTVITVAGLGIGSGFVTGMAMPGGVIENPALKTVM